MRILHKFRIMTTFIMSFSLLSCSNPLSGMSDQTSDEALYYSLKINLNDANYTDAITDCSDMSTDYQARDEVKFLCASAYAGRCGLKTLDMLTLLAGYEAQIGTQTLFEYLIDQISGTTLQDLADCDQAEDLMQQMGLASTRTYDENVFVIFLTLYKMAVVANLEADATEGGGVDVGFVDACVDVDDATTSVSMASAFWELNNTLGQISSSTYQSFKTIVTQICTDINGVSAAKNICAGATPPNFAADAEMRKGARMLLHEGAAIGLATCAAGPATFGNCECM